MLPTTLYHIRQEHLDLLSQLEEQEGELTPDPQSVLEEVPATWKVSKTKIKEALKAGTAVPGAELVTRQNLQIK